MKLKNPFIDESALEGDDSPKKSEDEQLMEEAKQHTEVVAAGAAVGSLLLGKMSFGMGIGMLIGLIAGSCIHKKPKQQAAETIEQSAERENNKENKE